MLTLFVFVRLKGEVLLASAYVQRQLLYHEREALLSSQSLSRALWPLLYARAGSKGYEFEGIK